MTARRTFLGALAASPALTTAAPVKTLPTVQIGDVRVSRLIAGYNPIGGYSHSVPKLSVLMKQWFTPERTVEFVHRCEREGINTWQISWDPKALTALKTAWDQGSKMQWLMLVREDEPDWNVLRQMKPVAVVHHGEFTDRYFKSGQQSKIRDFVNRAHDLGLRAGISSHNPENIERCEAADWGQDLYMTCFYNIRRDEGKVLAGLGDLPVDELYLSKDPERMVEAVNKVKRPCLAFKILAAGRRCRNAREVEQAFAFAYSKLRAIDGAIVGMFPIVEDEIAMNAAFARKYAIGT